MAIIQISKLQQRSGNLVDLPQLDDAEFGWATDSGQLYIGKGSPAENIEVLTSYSNISFSQITDSGGNIFVSAAEDGQILAYDGTQWVNRGGVVGGLINLGSNTDVKISGGSIGYVLETDGTGNLAWTSKGVLVSNIANVTQAFTGVVTTVGAHNLPDGTEVTITDVGGMTELNGNVYNAKVLTSDTFELYVLSTPVDTRPYGACTPLTGRTVAAISGSGAGAAGGSTTSVQYNNAGISSGDANITFDFSSPVKVLTVNGNANIGNLNSYRVFSNVATGTPPIVVTSTTRVANLNVAYANVSDYNVITNQTTGTFYPTFVGGNLSANYALGSTANLSFNAATGALSATLLTGTLTTAAQPNITSTGLLTSLTVTGTATAGNLTTGGTLSVTGNANVGNLGTTGLIIATGNISGGNVNAGNLLIANYIAGTLTTAAQPNITSVGILSSLTTTSITSGATATIGTITGNWHLAAGSKLNSTYADLAEYYEADAMYEPGTVLMFGGDKEVTLAVDATNKIAGVVSTNPAYLMNSLCIGAYTSAIALQGRVPCRVRGTIHKGDMLISGGDGFARPSASPLMGTVIGKSLEDFNGVSGIIECAVGRL